jgi:predicted peptidase
MNKSYRFIFTALLLVSIFSCKKSKDSKPEEPPAPTETQPPILVPITMAIHEKIGGFYLAHPARYNESTTRYPLILFIHGGGQYGTGGSDLPNVLKEGIPKLLSQKKFPAAFDVNGRQYSFIIIAPQFRNFPDNDAVATMLAHAKNNYRIDTNRIYLVGFSLGGRVVCDYAAENASKLAAMVPISGVSSYALQDKARSFAQAGLPAWGFHNRPDQVFSWQDTQDFITQMNVYDPGKTSQVTIFPDSTGVQYHDAWTKATDPAYKEAGKNIYEWMLQFRR